MRPWFLTVALSVLVIVPCGIFVVFGQPIGHPVLTVSHEGLQWTEAAGAAGYEVVRGDVAALRRSGGDSDPSTLARVVEFSSRTEMPCEVVPEIGQAFWFLVRAFPDTGAGTPDTGNAIGDRPSPFGAERLYGVRRQLGGGDSAFIPVWKATLSTSSTTYTAGQDVLVTFTLKNISTGAVTLNYATTCEAAFQVEDALGSVVYDHRAHQGCFMILTERTWQPNQSVVYSFTWHQTNDAGQQVPAGASYRIRGLGDSYEPVPSAEKLISIEP